MDVMILLHRFESLGALGTISEKAKLYGPFTSPDDAEMFLLNRGWEPIYGSTSVFRKTFSQQLFRKDEWLRRSGEAEIISKPHENRAGFPK